MNAQASNYTVNGTAALKLTEETSNTQARIIAFPALNVRHATIKPCNGFAAKFRGTLHRTLLGSEMYCSLKMEDVRGVAFGILSKSDSRLLAGAGCLVAVISLAFGA